MNEWWILEIVEVSDIRSGRQVYMGWGGALAWTLNFGKTEKHVGHVIWTRYPERENWKENQNQTEVKAKDQSAREPDLERPEVQIWKHQLELELTTLGLNNWRSGWIWTSYRGRAPNHT